MAKPTGHEGAGRARPLNREFLALLLSPKSWILAGKWRRDAPKRAETSSPTRLFASASISASFAALKHYLCSPFQSVTDHRRLLRSKHPPTKLQQKHLLQSPTTTSLAPIASSPPPHHQPVDRRRPKLAADSEDPPTLQDTTVLHSVTTSSSTEANSRRRRLFVRKKSFSEI